MNWDNLSQEACDYLLINLNRLIKNSEFPKFIGSREVSFWDVNQDDKKWLDISLEKMKTQITVRVHENITKTT